ncbi:MAG: aminopeptidase [Desulfobacterales bacterium]|jgi:aminopeptidase|nr:aminopeptidase [Desulfobacteraceae bacterium]MDD3991516.1 aminopeptidase [Desulfobacteraceae bacterium]MDY0312193.1 aminopeptidase [Desulfobacterales bacterium]
MLTDLQRQRYADVLWWGLKTARQNRFRKGDVISLRFGLPALPLAEVVFQRLIDLGFNPVVRPMLNAAMERSFYQGADNRQLGFVPPGEPELYGRLNGSIFIHAPESLTHLREVDPRRIGRAAVARKPLKEILDQREQAGDFGWTLCAWPTADQAVKADLSLKDYSRQIVRACFLDRRDPVAQWQEIHRQATSIKRWLSGLPVKTLHITSAHTDLEVKPGENRRWLGVSGHNIPSFELFVSPDWRGTRGVYHADQPSYRSGNIVSGVRLTFARGRVVEAAAEQGEAFLRAQLAMDPGACRIGEFSLTDRRFSKIDRFMANTLFDENFGGRQGNCHIAVGAAYLDAYDGDPATLDRARRKALGFNDSALHWDLVNTEAKRVSARLKDGRSVVIYENGRFAH